MDEISLPRSDEPFDFRRQAPGYSRYRRNYSDALYAAIEERTGPAAGRRALDLGCGTGLVTSSLSERGWRPIGADFSAPMLAQARAALGTQAPLVRARSEALPFASDSYSLVTCGTAFHWFAPRPSLAEMRRALVPGGWVALWWRNPVPEEPTAHLIREVIERFGVKLPEVSLTIHPAQPFSGSTFEATALTPIRLDASLEYTAESFHGYVTTTEFLRRMAGPHHADFLAGLREELDKRYPDGLVEQCHEHLFLAQRPKG